MLPDTRFVYLSNFTVLLPSIFATLFVLGVLQMHSFTKLFMLKKNLKMLSRSFFYKLFTNNYWQPKVNPTKKI